MLINLSNHPKEKWSKEQTESANKQFGEVVDLQFPAVDPLGDENYIATLADRYVDKIKEMSCNEKCTVHLMGEMTLTFRIISQLKNLGIGCVAATTERMVTEKENGDKEVKFNFVQFRKYL